VPWYKYMVPLLPDNPQVVEVGCWHGRSTACLAVELINHKQTFNLWAVDHWLGCNEPFYFQNIILEELAEDQPYKIFLKNMQPIITQLNIIRDTSVRAAEQFEDNSLDLVILDDEHGQDGVMNSIVAWWPKVKPNGILCGDDHDVNYPGVINAVREVFGSKDQSYNIFTKLGWGATLEDVGVWTVVKTSPLLHKSLIVPEDPWELKIPYKIEPDPEPEVIEETVEFQEEKIIPISYLQNPKKHSII
jgi:hypothetical protein